MFVHYRDTENIAKYLSVFVGIAFLINYFLGSIAFESLGITTVTLVVVFSVLYALKQSHH